MLLLLLFAPLHFPTALNTNGFYLIQPHRGCKVQLNRLWSSLSPALLHRNWDVFCERQMERIRVCEGINTAVMDGFTVLRCDWLVSPVSVRRRQAEWVHVSQRGGGDTISTNRPYHGVCSSLQKQAHQLKVSWRGIIEKTFMHITLPPFKSPSLWGLKVKSSNVRVAQRNFTWGVKTSVKIKINLSSTI